MSKATNFTAEDLQVLNTAETLEAAQTMLHAIVDKAATGKSPIKPEKVAQLHRNIDAAASKNEVIRTGWNMLMSGEGLATISSTYQRKFA